MIPKYRKKCRYVSTDKPRIYSTDGLDGILLTYLTAWNEREKRMHESIQRLQNYEELICPSVERLREDLREVAVRQWKGTKEDFLKHLDKLLSDVRRSAIACILV